MTGKLLFLWQVFDFMQVAVAQFEVFHLVGRMRAQHQSQGAVVACFFVLQDFGGFLFGFFKTAFKICQTRAVQRGRSLTTFAGNAEALHTRRNVQEAEHEFNQEIQDEYAQQQA